MPLNLLGPGETQKQDKCYQSKDMVEVGYLGSESLASTNAFTEATFTADQNYFLQAISLSMIAQSAVGAASAISVVLGWFKSQYTTAGNTGINPGNSSPLSSLPGSLAMVTAYWTRSTVNVLAAPPSNLFLNFHPFGVYLPKGNQLFLMAAGNASGAFISYSTILYLMPTFI